MGWRRTDDDEVSLPIAIDVIQLYFDGPCCHISIAMYFFHVLPALALLIDCERVATMDKEPTPTPRPSLAQRQVNKERHPAFLSPTQSSCDS